MVCKVILLTNVFSIDESFCHFLTIRLEDICTTGFKLTTVEWLYSLLTLLQTSNWHSLAQTHFNNLNTKIFRVFLEHY